MKRLRVSLRLMLLLVALFAMFSAWLGARRNQERVDLRGVEGRLMIARKYWAGRLDDPLYGSKNRLYLKEVDAAIEENHKKLQGFDRVR